MKNSEDETSLWVRHGLSFSLAIFLKKTRLYQNSVWTKLWWSSVGKYCTATVPTFSEADFQWTLLSQWPAARQRHYGEPLTACRSPCKCPVSNESWKAILSDWVASQHEKICLDENWVSDAFNWMKIVHNVKRFNIWPRIPDIFFRPLFINVFLTFELGSPMFFRSLIVSPDTNKQTLLIFFISRFFQSRQQVDVKKIFLILNDYYLKKMRKRTMNER